MREHDIKLHSADDLLQMRIGHAVQCRRCGSRVFSWLDMKQFQKVLDTKSVEQSVFDKLFKEWKRTVPVDCDEAKALNLAREVHES